MSLLAAAFLGLLLGAVVGFLYGWDAAEACYSPAAFDGRDEFDDQEPN